MELLKNTRFKNSVFKKKQDDYQFKILFENLDLVL
jgi:hypothetical protein